MVRFARLEVGIGADYLQQLHNRPAGLFNLSSLRLTTKPRALAAIAILLILIPGPFAIPGARGSSALSTASDQGVPVGTFLYLWYGYNLTSQKWTGGLATTHWNDSFGNVVVDTPSVSVDGTHFYPSLNNNTLAWQLSQMQQAGISVIIVSWWGSGNATQSTQPGTSPAEDAAIDSATINLFRYVEATQNLWKFKIAIMVDGFYGNSSAVSWPHLYGYLYTKYYHPYDDLAFYWQGKPLVLFFNTPSINQLNEVPRNYTFTTRLIGSVPNQVNWYFWEGMNFLDTSGGSSQPANYEYSPGISPDGEVGLASRYDDFYQRPSGYMRFDYTLGQGMYYSEWNYAVAHARELNLVLVYGWNEYHERTELEPHADKTSGYFSGVGDTSYFVTALESAVNSAPPSGTPGSPVDLSYAFIAVAIGLGIVLATAAILVRKR
jgi:hypothetical protein